MLTPATAAEGTGVSLDTLRYYEREGLIGPIRRSAGGRREYTDDDVFWIGLVTCFRSASRTCGGSSPSCAPSTPRRTGSRSCASTVPSWSGG
ncbi:MerR family transcriptional regulator [Streptomyces sp. NBC_00341]|nr:MerR family transcriptional regulator [Streptomyces sp. NBC_00341]